MTTPEDARAEALTWAEIDDWRRYQADDRVVAALDAGAQMAAALTRVLAELHLTADNIHAFGAAQSSLAAWRQAVAPR